MIVNALKLLTLVSRHSNSILVYACVNVYHKIKKMSWTVRKKEIFRWVAKDLKYHGSTNADNISILSFYFVLNINSDNAFLLLYSMMKKVAVVFVKQYATVMIQI